jgi:hypothetical protein
MGVTSLKVPPMSEQDSVEIRKVAKRLVGFFIGNIPSHSRGKKGSHIGNQGFRKTKGILRRPFGRIARALSNASRHKTDTGFET